MAPRQPAATATQERKAPMISVIIPTLNEAGTIGPLAAALAAEATPHEVIVVDGGSTDGTAALAAASGARVVTAPRGRGHQLRAGAETAVGDVLLFLHADSRPAPGMLAALAETLADPAVTGGNFRILFDGGDGFSRWLTGFYAWFRRRGLYYGDSGIFVRRAAYQRIGGMPDIAVMEDYVFARRLERLGGTVCIAEPPLTTSSRRFHGRHPVRIVAGWLVMHTLHHLGVAPERLARLYDRRRS